MTKIYSWFMGLDALQGNGITRKLLYFFRDKALTPADWERECTPLSAGAMSKQAEREEAYEAAVKVVGPP